MDNPVNNNILEDFFIETFEDIEEKKKDFNYIEEIIRKTNPDLRMYQKKNERTGRTYFNFKKDDIVMSMDLKNPGYIKRYDLWLKEERKSIFSPELYNMLARASKTKTYDQLIRQSDSQNKKYSYSR